MECIITLYLYLYLEVLEVGRYEAGDNYSSKSSILRHHQAAQILGLTRPALRDPLTGDILELRLAGWLTGQKK